MDYVLAFVTGGAICALVQLLMEKTKLMPGRIMVLLVCTGAVISAIGLYEPFSEWAGAKEAVDMQGFLGIFLGGFKAGAAGISGALIFGYIASLLVNPRMKK